MILENYRERIRSVRGASGFRSTGKAINIVNRFCHSIGIPLIVASIVLAAISLFARSLWIPAVVMFIAGWFLQFAGHGFERKPPEFFRDWRFLFAGLRWSVQKMRGGV